MTGIRRQPLGLLYIASSLSAAGYSPLLLNCHTPKKSVMDLPGEFGYLKRYIGHNDPGLRFPFKSYSHYGMSWQEIESRVKNINADIYLISSLFTTYFSETEKIIEVIRKHSKESFIAVGGYHPSLYPEYFMNNTGADFVLTGEGELASAALVKMIEKGGSPSDVPGLVYRGSEGIAKSGSVRPEIGDLPEPARGMLLPRDFSAYGKRLVSMIASRGCPNRCDFCTGRTIWGSRYRPRGVDEVVREISACRERYGADIINFEDDNLFPSGKRAEDLLPALAELRERHFAGIEFTAMNGVSLESIDEDTVALMKRAGFNELNISLVSHSPAIQESSGRPFDSEKFRRVAAGARSAGLNVRGYFIMGLPGQDVREIKDTISFMRGLDISVFPSVFYNVHSPASQWKMQRSSAFFNETPELSRDDLLREFNACMRQ